MPTAEILLKIQSELHCGKDKYNTFGGFAYRTAEGILAAAKPLCLKHGALLTLSDDLLEIGGKIFLKSTASITALEAGAETISSTGYAMHEKEPKAKMSEPQATGSASSFARKYALCALFCIADPADDPDGREVPQQPAIPPQYQNNNAGTIPPPPPKR